MSSSRHPAPPPAANLVVLASDLLAAAVKTMMDELAGAGHWPAAQRVRQCLDAYDCARSGSIITEAASDPQQCTVANWEQAPQTKRSAHHA